MKRALLILALTAAAAIPAPAQEAGPGRGREAGVRRGTLTFVSGEVYYVSLGSPDGMADSTRVFVVAKGGDTVATLVVFAVSSKSSACRLLSSARAPVVGDAVVARIGVAAAAARDTVGGGAGAAGAPGTPPGAGTETAGREAAGKSSAAGSSPPWLKVRGRVTAQYNTYIVDSSRSTITQPSLSMNMRGDFAGAPVRFEFAGIVRSTVTGSTAPFGPGGVGRSRLYRLSIEYDDAVNRVGIGRLLPYAGLPSGFIDGVAASRKFGVVALGAAAGFEPDYRYQHPVTNRKKIMAFTGAGSAEPFTWSAGAAYARTFLESAVERSVASASAMAAPSRTVSFSAQTEVDFQSVRNGAVLKKARLSSLLAQLNVRVTDEVSLGAGVISWRPVYPLSTVEDLPDSMKDDQLWVTPSVSLRVYTGGGFSLSDQYATRTHGDGFGDDQSNTASLAHDNIARSGVGLRLTQTVNHTSIATSTGYGAALRRMFGDLVEAGLRYQSYRNDYRNDAIDDRTTSFGADVNLPIGASLYLMLTGELAHGTIQDYRLLNGSLSWRF
jgi:hypothetical protein